jgi:hypothetical protein
MDSHIQIKLDGDRCGNRLEVQAGPGGLMLPPKVCLLPKDHPGHHSDGSAVWLNLHRKLQEWDGRKA